MRRSPIYTPETPFELQREEGETHVVVAYYAATPEEAGLPGYRVVKREAPAAKKKGA